MGSHDLHRKAQRQEHQLVFLRTGCSWWLFWFLHIIIKNWSPVIICNSEIKFLAWARSGYELWSALPKRFWIIDITFHVIHVTHRLWKFQTFPTLIISDNQSCSQPHHLTCRANSYVNKLGSVRGTCIDLWVLLFHPGSNRRKTRSRYTMMESYFWACDIIFRNHSTCSYLLHHWLWGGSALVEINQVSKRKSRGKGQKGKSPQKGKGKDKGKSKDAKGKGKGKSQQSGQKLWFILEESQAKTTDVNRSNYFGAFGHWNKDCRKFQADKASSAVRQGEGDEKYSQHVASSRCSTGTAQKSPSATSYRSTMVHLALVWLEIFKRFFFWTCEPDFQSFPPHAHSDISGFKLSWHHPGFRCWHKRVSFAYINVGESCSHKAKVKPVDAQGRKLDIRDTRVSYSWFGKIALSCMNVEGTPFVEGGLEGGA